MSKKSVSGLNNLSNSLRKKTWRKFALLLFVLMLLGKAIFVVFSPDDAPVVDAEKDKPVAVTYQLLEDRFSEGDRLLIPHESTYTTCADRDRNPDFQEAEFELAKKTGIESINQKKYAAAANAFEKAWNFCHTPEVLIYWNNAKIGDSPSRMLAISVPITILSNPKNAIEMLRGAAQAQRTLNESGGANAVPIKLLVIDDGDNPEIAKNIAVSVIEARPDVLAIIGHWTSGVTLQAAYVYEKREAMVFMTPISTTTGLTGDSGWVFRSTVNVRDEQKILVNHILNVLGYQRVAIFALDADSVGREKALYSEGVKDEFTQAFTDEGGTVVANFDLSSSGFSREGWVAKIVNTKEATAKKMVKQAKAAGAEAVFVVPNNSSVGNAEAVITEAYKQGLRVIGATNLYRNDVIKRNCSAIEDMVMTIAWKANGKANSEFAQAASNPKVFWQGEVNFATAMTYNATQAMAAAMKDNPTRIGIHDALNDPSFSVKNTADAKPMTFKNGNRTADAQLVKVVRKPANGSQPESCQFVPIDS
jgi:branched-chain amino acid transport system substrate-binding protein